MGLLASHAPSPSGTARETKRLDGVTRAPLYSAMGDVADGLATLRAHQQWPDAPTRGKACCSVFFGWIFFCDSDWSWWDFSDLQKWIYLHFWAFVGWPSSFLGFLFLKLPPPPCAVPGNGIIMGKFNGMNGNWNWTVTEVLAGRFSAMT